MITIKKLSSNGDKEVPKMIDAANAIGVELIELLWTPDDGQTRHSPAEVSGYVIPKVDLENVGVTDSIDAIWIDGCTKFYPDEYGRCYGYVFDVPENREKLYRSFSNGWFRIVEKRIREELMKEAEERGFETTPAEKIDFIVKKTKREKEAESHIKTLERQLEETKQKFAKLEQEMAEATGEKATHMNRRLLKGVKLPKRNEILEEKNADIQSD